MKGAKQSEHAGRVTHKGSKIVFKIVFELYLNDFRNLKSPTICTGQFVPSAGSAWFQPEAMLTKDSLVVEMFCRTSDFAVHLPVQAVLLLTPY